MTDWADRSPDDEILESQKAMVMQTLKNSHTLKAFHITASKMVQVTEGKCKKTDLLGGEEFDGIMFQVDANADSKQDFNFECTTCIKNTFDLVDT